MEEKNDKNLKVAIVHDFLEQYGGAEGVLKCLCEIYPQAPIFTLLCDKNRYLKWGKGWLDNREIHPSMLQKFPKFIRKRKRWLLPFMPMAAETFNLRDYDLVISSSSAFAKGIVVKPRTAHICYMHAPMRYVWDWQNEYLDENRLGKKRKLLARFLLNYLRMWDRSSADRPDLLIANSSYTAERAKKYYRREAEIVFPPVATDEFSVGEKNEGYFLTVARLSAYKKVELIVDAFKKLNLPLIVVGEGRDLEKLKEQIGNAPIKILGWLEREKLVKLYQNCRAFVFAAEDDFGIAPVEAMAAGKPVIALRKGGVTETIIEGKTGDFFDYPEVEILADGVRKFIENEAGYNAEEIRKRAEEFSEELFKNKFQQCVNKTLTDKRD